MKKESDFQRDFIKGLKDLGFKCIRVKASGNVNKSYPDYAIFYRFFWGWLEFKKFKDAEVQPGQKEKVEWANENSFGAFVYPENSQAMIDRLTNIKLNEDRNYASRHNLRLR